MIQNVDKNPTPLIGQSDLVINLKIASYVIRVFRQKSSFSQLEISTIPIFSRVLKYK
jgi:hypothetical protein